MNMEINEVLEKIGLNEKEASVYLALLELGSASVLSIARKAGIKRPTTYLILDDLQAKGLVSEVPQSKKALYTAESPDRLTNELNKKEELLKRFLPNLLALHNAKKEKPQVLLFQGKEGVREVYRKIFAVDAVDFFGTIQEVYKIDPEGLQDYLRKLKTNKIQVREILSRSKDDMEYADMVQGLPNDKVCFVPEGMGFPTDSAIFGDSIVFFSFRPQIFAVMITSREVAQSMRTLFELAWRSSEPYKR